MKPKMAKNLQPYQSQFLKTFGGFKKGELTVFVGGSLNRQPKSMIQPAIDPNKKVGILFPEPPPRNWDK